MSSFNIPLPLELKGILARNSEVVLSSDQPDAPAGHTNVDWQTDEFGNLSANVPNGGGGGTPGGDPAELQYNNSGAFGGASGGTTNGSHFAFGTGSTVDGAAPVFFDGNPVSTKTVSVISETYTGVDLENGQYIGITLNPVSAPVAPDIATYSTWNNFTLEGENWTPVNEAIASVNTVNYMGNVAIGPGLLNASENVAAVFGAAEMPFVVGDQSWVYHGGTGTIDLAQGDRNNVTNLGGGTVTQAIGTLAYVENDNGTTVNAHEVDIYFTSSDGTTNENVGIYVETPALSGGATITNNYGVYIQEQAASGVSTPWQLYSAGSSPSRFIGPVDLPYTTAQTIYSVAGTPLPSAAAVGTGARAFVSDATAVTFGAPYVGGQSGKAPVYSDGTNWYMG